MADEKIRIIVEPDTSGFSRDLESDLKRIDQDFTVDVKADTTQLNTELKTTRTKQESDAIDIPVDVETTKATTEMQRLTARIAAPVMKIINANVAPAIAQVSRFTAQASRPIVKTVSLVTTGASKALTGLQGVSSKSFNAISRHAKSAGATIATALIGAAVLGKDELIESERANAQTESRLKSTKGIANVTTKAIKGLSDELLRKTGIDDQATQNAQNMLLTFTKVRNEAGAGNQIFDQATRSIADMATTMAGGAIPTAEQMQASTIRLGKALNDPVKGVALLSKAGVQFTEQQKDQIKALLDSGDQLGAQKIILQELQTQFGGAAEAIPDAEKGLARLREAAAGAGSGLLKNLLPVLLPLAEKIQDAFDTGQVGKFLKSLNPIVEGAKAIFNAIMVGLSEAGTGKEQLDGIAAVAKALGDGMKFLAPVIGVIVTSLVVVVREAIELFTGLGNFIGDAAFKATEFWAALQTAVPAAIAAVGNFVTSAINLIGKLLKWFLLLPFRIGMALGKLFLTMIKWWIKIQVKTLTILGKVLAFINSIPGRIFAVLAGLAQRLFQIAWNAFQKFRDAVIDRVRAVLTFIGQIKSAIAQRLSGAGSWLYNTGRAIINGLWNGMKDVWNDIAGWLGGLKDKIIDLKGPPETDSTLLVDNGRRIMSGFWEGMKSRWEPVSDWLGGIGGWLKELVSPGDANKEIAQVIAGNKTWSAVSQALDPTAGLLSGAVGGAGGAIGPAKDKYDVYAQGQLLAKAFNVAISSWMRSIVDNSQAGGSPTSQHLTGFAVDFAGIWQNMDKLAKFAMQLVGKAFTQVLWQVRDHFDHVHVGWLHRRHGGRVDANQPMIVGETGQEGWIPDRPGMILSNTKLQRLLSLGRRMDKVEQALSVGVAGGSVSVRERPTIQQNNEITLVHPVPDPASVLAALNSRLDMFARTATAGLST